MKKNKIVNKIGILVLAVMLSILSSITVLASEPEEAELGPRQDISKNLTTGEITVNEIPANLLLLLILVHIVYVLIRWYVKGCMRSRGYY